MQYLKTSRVEALAEIFDFAAGLVQRVPKRMSIAKSDLQNSTASQDDQVGGLEFLQDDRSWEVHCSLRLWNLEGSATVVVANVRSSEVIPVRLGINSSLRVTTTYLHCFIKILKENSHPERRRCSKAKPS